MNCCVITGKKCSSGPKSPDTERLQHCGQSYWREAKADQHHGQLHWNRVQGGAAKCPPKLCGPIRSTTETLTLRQKSTVESHPQSYRKVNFWMGLTCCSSSASWAITTRLGDRFRCWHAFRAWRSPEFSLQDQTLLHCKCFAEHFGSSH